METVSVLDVVRLQGLIAEYGRLRRLEGHTRQTRGQRLNEVVAEMLRCWGIEARTSIRSLGEIDVGFSVGGVRYVVEAKWEQAKTDTGHVAKLQKRVRQRFAGTCGVFLSMSGYSREALADVAHGERLEVLLLDAAHFEAMLAGLVPPEEMLSLLHDRAAFYGEANTPLATLVASTVAPQVMFGAPNSLTAPLLRSSRSGVAGEVLFSVPDSNQLGLACLDPDRLLVTTQQGIMAVDLARRSARWAVPVSGCHRSPIVDGSGAVLFTRRTGAGRYHDGELAVMGGGFAGNTWLMRHPDGRTWVFGNGEPGGAVGAAVTRLGDRLGDEERMAYDYPAGSAMNGCWVNGREVIAVGGSGLSVSAPGGPSRWLRLPQTNSMGLVRLSPTSVLTGGDAISLLCTDLGTGQSAEVACLNLSGSTNELAVATDGSGGRCGSRRAGRHLRFRDTTRRHRGRHDAADSCCPSHCTRPLRTAVGDGAPSAGHWLAGITPRPRQPTGRVRRLPRPQRHLLGDRGDQRPAHHSAGDCHRGPRYLDRGQGHRRDDRGVPRRPDHRVREDGVRADTAGDRSAGHPGVRPQRHLVVSLAGTRPGRGHAPGRRQPPPRGVVRRGEHVP